ncbi:proliferating cell nuclear antigen, N-terminal domain-containing protein [Phakopsora pachyrhizi]|nr:proliferating cell nuclear antigen, N-terminal domain-containing protein [Phakopsora pachyrhizi]
MFEAKLSKAGLLKLVLESVKELVTDVNFDCDEEGMKLQAMDNSHVALVSLQLRSSGFTQYRCDRTMTLGINIGSFQKIVRCASNDDILTLRAQDDADLLNVIFETEKTDRLAEYEMKMMDIDIEHLGIPDTDYDAEISLPSSEFNRIIRDLKEMGESVRIEATKEGVKFSADGDIGKGSNGDVKKDKKKAKAEPKDEEDFSVSISLQQSVSLTFSIKYLSNFTKASPLASRVTLHMSNEVPLLVAYEFETGYVRYYLAPKIEDD